MEIDDFLNLGNAETPGVSSLGIFGYLSEVG